MLSMSSQRCPWQWSTMTSSSKDELSSFSTSAEGRPISMTTRTSRLKEVLRNQVLLKSENNWFHRSLWSRRLKMRLWLALSWKNRTEHLSRCFLKLWWNSWGNIPKWKQCVQSWIWVTDRNFQVLICTHSIKYDQIY